MKYSTTGEFTPNQIKLAKEISDRLKKLERCGCRIIAKQTSLYCYKKEDIDNAQPLHSSTGSDYVHPLKYLDCGYIMDSGADDTEYFPKGYITEE